MRVCEPNQQRFQILKTASARVHVQISESKQKVHLITTLKFNKTHFKNVNIDNICVFLVPFCVCVYVTDLWPFCVCVGFQYVFKRKEERSAADCGQNTATFPQHKYVQVGLESVCVVLVLLQ